MSYRLMIAAAAVGLVTAVSASAQFPTPTTISSATQRQGDMVLWYREPAAQWLDAMPIGNGFMGAMVFGKIENERIALNESSFWSGRPHDYDDPNAGQYFPVIRNLVFAGKFQEAEKITNEHFYGIPAAQQAFQPLGDLVLSFDGVDAGAIKNYRRELDMETGVATVRYRAADTVFTREVFLSYPDRVMVVRITADEPGRVGVRAKLRSPYQDRVTAAPDKLVMDGRWKGPMPEDWLIATVEGEGIRFQTVLMVRTDGGRVTAVDDQVRIEGADAVTFVVTAGTSYVNYKDIGGNPAAICSKTLAGVADKDYATLRKRHEADFTSLMGRVHLTVGDASRNAMPTNERIRAMRTGDDASLESLCFQFGRYILASSSRAGGQPANLQGIWNESIVPNWGSKYTININTEMNYWPAEVCNLSECHQPLFDMLKDISVTGGRTARVYYGCNGWVTHHNVDLWRGTAPVDAARYGMWPLGGAWLTLHLWEHYAYTGDREFLKEYYPIIKGSAQFLLELMVEHPEHRWLVTPFSMSPEHGYLDSEGRLCFLSPSPTMDVAIIHELFPACIEASKVLGIDESFRGKLEVALTRLPPYRVNRLGYLQEWIEDWRPGGQGHNFSPTFTFFPGSSIRLNSDPALVDAIRKWMESRRGRGGFPLAWDICLWARLQRGDKVASCIKTFVRDSVAASLHNRGSNQSDGSFGFAAGVAESLLQSHAGEISLLPGLSTAWDEGSVTGLRARGGFEVNMQWKQGKLVSAAIRSDTGGSCKVRCGEKTTSLAIAPGQTVRLMADLTMAGPAVARTPSTKTPPSRDPRYRFDGTISREVLENYLDRAVTMAYFLVTGKAEGNRVYSYREDDVRLIQNTGAKFIGRAIYRWNGENRLSDPSFWTGAEQLITRVHAFDPDVIFQGCLFETISPSVNGVKIPTWVFADFGLPVEERTFSYEAMLNRDGRLVRHWGRASVPDVTRLETQLWFYYLAGSYIDLGCEALHLGQVGLIGMADPNLKEWSRLVAKIRSHAKVHARRHLVLLDAHVPTGGMVVDGVSLLDFNSFPMRIKEVSDKPYEAVLEVGYLDAIFKRSKGCISPSGWSCDSLPYLVEFDNYGRARTPNVADTNSIFVWGWDEISWFSLQDESYRNQWLVYAYDCIKKTDANGHLQMPVSRMITCPNKTLGSYRANTKNRNCPIGYSQEETIKAIWIGSN